MLPLKTRLYILLIIVALLTILDLLATWQLIDQYGIQMEINPITRWLFGLGPGIATTIKMTILLLFLIIIPIGAQKNFPLAYGGTWIVVLAMGTVTIIHAANCIVK